MAGANSSKTKSSATAKKGHSLSLKNRKQTGFNDRSTSTVKRLLMYKNSTPFRDSKGKITKEAPFQSTTKSGDSVRIEPNIRWFTNTRVVSQTALQKFRDEIGTAVHDPFKFVIKPSTQPLSLLENKSKHSRFHLLDVESYRDTFNKSMDNRKVVKHQHSSLEDLLVDSQNRISKFDSELKLEEESNKNADLGGSVFWRQGKMNSGSSHKFWNEVYKVIDSSHVLIEVIDARDPIGTRCHAIEQYLAKEKPFKNLILVLNKCDLVPTSMVKKWLFILSKQHPVVAFRATERKSFGKENLLNILRQFTKLHRIKPDHHLSVGLLGYPNVGKSSIINTLKDDVVCKVAPLPGQTKVWQYVSLTRNIYLIDCPGVVRTDHLTEEDVVLRSVVRAEHLEHPEKYIEPIINLCNPVVLSKIYKIKSFTGSENFLEQVAIKRGRLLKAAQPDLRSVAMNVIRDWQFGKIPHYVKPPEDLLNDAIEKSNKKQTNLIARDVEKNENYINNNESNQNASEHVQEAENPVSENENQKRVDLPQQTQDELDALLLNENDNDRDSEEEQEEDQHEDDKLNPIELDVDLGTIDLEENMILFEDSATKKPQIAKSDKSVSKNVKVGKSENKPTSIKKQNANSGVKYSSFVNCFGSKRDHMYLGSSQAKLTSKQAKKLKKKADKQ